MIVRGTLGAGVGVWVAVEIVDFGVGAVSKKFDDVAAGVWAAAAAAGMVREESVFETRAAAAVASCRETERVMCPVGGRSVTIICSPFVIGIDESFPCALFVTFEGSGFGGYPYFTFGCVVSKEMSGEKGGRGAGTYSLVHPAGSLWRRRPSPGGLRTMSLGLPVTS